MSELEIIIKKFRLRFSVFQRQHFVCPLWTTVFEHSGLFGKDVEADWRIFVTEGQYCSDKALPKLLITYILTAMQYDKKAFFPLQTSLAVSSKIVSQGKPFLVALFLFYYLVMPRSKDTDLLYLHYFIVLE